MQSILPGILWRHVPTHINPADCMSHGLAPDLFKTCYMVIRLIMIGSSSRVLVEFVPFGVPLEQRS